VDNGSAKRHLGAVGSTYRVVPTEAAARLVLKLVCDPPGGRILAAPYRWVMPWFDLFMMRKQFLKLKKRAEKTAALAYLGLVAGPLVSHENERPGVLAPRCGGGPVCRA